MLAGHLAKLKRRGIPERYAIDPQRFRNFLAMALRAHRLPTSVEQLAELPPVVQAHMQGALEGDHAALAQTHDLLSEHETPGTFLPGLHAILGLLQGRKDLPAVFSDAGDKHLPAEITSIASRKGVPGRPGAASPQMIFHNLLNHLVALGQQGGIPGFEQHRVADIYRSTQSTDFSPPWLGNLLMHTSRLNSRSATPQHMVQLHDLLQGLHHDPAIQGGQLIGDGDFIREVPHQTAVGVESGHQATTRVLHQLLGHMLTQK